MQRIAFLTRPALACMLLAAAAWVALPVAGLFFPRVDSAGSDAKLVEADGPASPPLRHVIRDVDNASVDVSASPSAPVVAQSLPQAPAPPVEEPPQPPGPPSTPTPTPENAPLPPVPAALSSRPPPLDATYRSTVEIPPPPLLDATSPSPLAARRAARRPRIDPPTASGWQPAYAVRDGDDLTAIAVRFYGNPAAAEAIWLANRDRIPDPQVLPIGVELALPPPASAGIPSGGRDRLIEPL